jgi:hypothetical protein
MALTKVSYSMIAGEVANVLDYGAYRDGTNAAATTAAIQAALNSGVGSVFLPAGRYLVNDTLYVPSSTTMFGIGAYVDPYTKETKGSILVSDSGAFSSQKSVVQVAAVGESELTSVTLRDFLVDIRNADSTAIGVRKQSVNQFQMINVYVLGILNSANTQIAYFNGNGTHSYLENIKLYGTKYACYMDNTPGRECHDSVFNKVWMYPSVISGATCLYFHGGEAITTWIMPYFETDNSGTVTGIYNANATEPQLTMIFPVWDGSFLWQWNADQPPLTRIFGSSASSFDPGDWNGNFTKCTLIGREGSQLVKTVNVMADDGESRFGVSDSGFNFGKIASGAAKIARIQGGKNTSVLVGSVGAGDSFEFNLTVTNGEVGNPVLVGFDWTGTTPIQLTGHMTSDSTCRVTLTNLHSSSVDFGTRAFKAVAFNGAMT